MWGWIAFDPAVQTIYYGTANPGPWNAQQRPGDNKWTAGISRPRHRDRGGQVVLPCSARMTSMTHDAINEQILLDMPFAGKMRPVIFRAERNGYVYILDRNTGQVLSADSCRPVNRRAASISRPAG